MRIAPNVLPPSVSSPSVSPNRIKKSTPPMRVRSIKKKGVDKKIFSNFSKRNGGTRKKNKSYRRR
jgi:hypothetical protein